MRHECPDPDRKNPVQLEEIECPACGKKVEIWSNENAAKCPSCSKEFTREQLRDQKGLS